MAEHVDPADLAEIALENGESGGTGAHGEAGNLTHLTEQRAHIAACSRCRRELDALRAVVRAARSAGPGDRLSEPPDRVWRSIQRQLHAPEPSPDADRTERATALAAPARPAPRSARRSARVLAALALVAGLAVGGGVGWWQASENRPATLQSTGAPHRLAPRPGHTAAGTVELAKSPAEGRVLKVTVHGLPDTGGYFEVWLMDPSGRRLIPVGALGQDGSATLPVPHGVDLPSYPVVDVSDQAYDGDPAHSGRSVVRGVLAG